MTSTISCPTGGSSKCCQEAKLEQSSIQLHQEHVDYSWVGSQWEELTVSGSSGFTSLRTSPGLITPTSSLKQQFSFLCSCKRLNMEKGDISTSIRSITGGLVKTLPTSAEQICHPRRSSELQERVQMGQNR